MSAELLVNTSVMGPLGHMVEGALEVDNDHVDSQQGFRSGGKVGGGAGGVGDELPQRLGSTAAEEDEGSEEHGEASSGVHRSRMGHPPAAVDGSGVCGVVDCGGGRVEWFD